MFQDSLEVEVNMMESGKIKQKVETNKRKAREENVPSAFVVASSNDVKSEMMLKTLEKLMDKLTVEKRPLNREHNEPQIINPNFRRPNPPPLPQII